MGTPCSWDMKPRMEKTTNPATKLVALFKKQRAMQSLWAAEKMGRKREKETHQPLWGRETKTRSQVGGGEGERKTQFRRWTHNVGLTLLGTLMVKEEAPHYPLGRCSSQPPHPPASPPVAVVVVLVVAAQGCQAPLADGKGEEDLGARIHPHLRETPGCGRKTDEPTRAWSQ